MPAAISDFYKKTDARRRLFRFIQYNILFQEVLNHLAGLVIQFGAVGQRIDAQPAFGQQLSKPQHDRILDIHPNHLSTNLPRCSRLRIRACVIRKDMR